MREKVKTRSGGPMIRVVTAVSRAEMASTATRLSGMSR